MKKIKIDDNKTVIKQGQVVVNHVNVLVDQKNLKVWNIDSRSKYLDQVEIMREDNNALTAWLWAGENTIKTDDTQELKFTIVNLGFVADEKWFFMSETGRYDTRIVGYRILE